MQKSAVLDTVRFFARSLGAASSAAAALAESREPSDHALRRMGIDPADYRGIRR